jgi:hypothetical protein
MLPYGLVAMPQYVQTEAGRGAPDVNQTIGAYTPGSKYHINKHVSSLYPALTQVHDSPTRDLTTLGATCDQHWSVTPVPITVAGFGQSLPHQFNNGVAAIQLCLA